MGSSVAYLEVQSGTGQPAAVARPVLAPLAAQALYRLRRSRERLFPGQLFSEPAWDLMLDLLAAETGGSSVSVTSACIATSAPMTTAIRCLKRLEAEGLVYREADSLDKRRIYVRLSAEAFARMESLLQDLGGALAAASRNCHEDKR
jgi:hypothetical protein